MKKNPSAIILQFCSADPVVAARVRMNLAGYKVRHGRASLPGQRNLPVTFFLADFNLYSGFIVCFRWQDFE